MSRERPVQPKLFSDAEISTLRMDEEKKKAEEGRKKVKARLEELSKAFEKKSAETKLRQRLEGK